MSLVRPKRQDAGVQNERPGFGFVGAVLCLVVVVGCASMPSFRSNAFTNRVALSDGWLAMGTFFEVEIRFGRGEDDRARAWIEWARTEIARLELIYSRHDPNSAVSELNRKIADPGAIQGGAHLDPTIEAILFSAVEIWEGTGGAFDITIGPLVDVWIAAVANGEWPAVEQLRDAKRRVGSEGLLLLGDGKLAVTTGGMRIDLDGISKGAVLDRLRARFEADLPNAAALLSFGQSSVVAIGDPDGEGWRVDIHSRNPADTHLGTLRMRDQALSVSSSLGSVSEIAGERVSHIIDPRTGVATSETVEAIVLADRAEVADGWSTALLVIGANRTAIRLVEKAGLEANVLESSGRSVMTADWESALVARGERPAR